MTGPGLSVDEFVFRLHERSRCDSPSGPVIVATGTRNDGALVIVYREREGGPLLGRTFHLDQHAALFSPLESVQDLADIVYADELCDPSGRGTRLRVDWAQGLVPDPDEVGWLLTFAERAAFEREGLVIG